MTVCGGVEGRGQLETCSSQKTEAEAANVLFPKAAKQNIPLIFKNPLIIPLPLQIKVQILGHKLESLLTAPCLLITVLSTYSPATPALLPAYYFPNNY